jgi:hypothetical protein
MRMTNECGCPYGACDCDSTTKAPPHKCSFHPAKRGSHLVCSCGERFPCAERDCGHLDCWEERKSDPVCHFCNLKLKGPHNTEDATWGSMAIRGKTRAAHYCCRDANNSTPRRDIGCRALRGYMPELCGHEFEGKDSLTTAQVKLLADSYKSE